MARAKTTRLIYAIHKWTGLIAGINVLILSVTAAFLLVEAMAHEWQHDHETNAARTHHVLPSTRPPIQPYIDTLTTYYAQPELKVYRLDFGLLPGQPDKISFSGPTGFFRLAIDEKSGALSVDYGTPPEPSHPDATLNGLVFANPDTEASQDGYSALGQWMLALHADLFLGLLGTIATGIVGVFLLVSTVTGVMIYGPFMKALAFGAVRRGPRINHLMADLHKVVGIVTLMFNGTMALTGIGLTLGILAIQFYLLHELGAFEAQGGDIVVRETALSVETLLEEAEKVLPNTHVYRIEYPGGIQGDKSYAIYAQEDPEARTLVPIVAAVTAENAPRSFHFIMPLWIKAIVIGIPIHVGSFGGNLVRAVYLFFALSSGFLSVSGFILFGAKYRRRRSTASDRSTPSADTATGEISHG